MAARFWTGGTGNWDGTTASSAHWGTGTGGAGAPASGPGVNDTATFDGASGGGTVTVTGNITCQSITCGAFTGTLDFSANNNNVTLSGASGLSGTGTGTRTINLGNGIWTFTGVNGNTITFATTTGLTFNANSSVIVFTATSASPRTFIMGNLAWSTVTVNANSSGGPITFSGGGTIATLNVTSPNYLVFANCTITNGLNLNGSSLSSMIGIVSNGGPGTANTITSANNSTNTYCTFRDITFAGGGTAAATNSLDLGHNSGITITAPVLGGPAQLVNSQGLVG